MKIFQCSDTKLEDSLLKHCNSVSPNKDNVFLKASHCTVAGTAPTPWGRAPVCVTKYATQPPMAKKPPNRVPSGPNSLRSQVLYISYSSFTTIPASLPSFTCSSWVSSSRTLVFGVELLVIDSVILYLTVMHIFLSIWSCKTHLLIPIRNFIHLACMSLCPFF